jgi:hypothetical protein
MKGQILTWPDYDSIKYVPYRKCEFSRLSFEEALAENTVRSFFNQYTELGYL